MIKHTLSNGSEVKISSVNDDGFTRTLVVECEGLVMHKETRLTEAQYLKSIMYDEMEFLRTIREVNGVARSRAHFKGRKRYSYRGDEHIRRALK